MNRATFLGGAWFVASAFVLFPRSLSAQGSSAVRVVALGADGTWLEANNGHLSLSRAIPRPLSLAEEESERDAVRLVFIGLGQAPPPVQVSTYRRNDTLIDTLTSTALSAHACPPGSTPGPCWSTLPIRLTPDRLDRAYQATKERSVEAALGGELRIQGSGHVLARFQIGGPRSAAFAAYDRLSAKLRIHILRVTPGGTPAVGGDSASARRVVADEVAAAGKLWAACGIDLAGPTGPTIEVVDPPPTELVAIGCDSGLPASGGQIAFDVGGQHVRVSSHAGDAPLVVAQRLARALRALGLRVDLSPNQRTSSGASGAADLLVRNARGAGVTISAAPDLALSTDATLDVCLGEVDLSDGLTHFVESDASAGTLEERALVKAFDDGDPSTIDVFVVPSFDQSGRIGESFIHDDGSAIQNTVIIDRAALRAGPRSYALAHEIGHIFLDMPGHPDDYGVDESSSLMDADAADASVFGPRRLSITDCERALRESGPHAKVPLLRSWPLSDQRPPLPSVTSGR